MHAVSERSRVFMKISPTVQAVARQARLDLSRSLAWCVLGSALIALTTGCGSSSGGNAGSDAATANGQTTESGSPNTAGMEGGMAGGMDAAAMDDAPTVPIEAASPDGGGGGPATCSQYMGSCGASGGQCCSGLGCVNDTFCCVNPAGTVNGSCDFPYECCSGVCQDGGVVGICCSGSGQACSTVASCCTGLQCGSNGKCS
jgi:hypothetical protein